MCKIYKNDKETCKYDRNKTKFSCIRTVHNFLSIPTRPGSTAVGKLKLVKLRKKFLEMKTMARKGDGLSLLLLRYVLPKEIQDTCDRTQLPKMIKTFKEIKKRWVYEFLSKKRNS